MMTPSLRQEQEARCVQCVVSLPGSVDSGVTLTCAAMSQSDPFTSLNLNFLSPMRIIRSTTLLDRCRKEGQVLLLTLPGGGELSNRESGFEAALENVGRVSSVTGTTCP